MAKTTDPNPASPATRVRISCPGCGRHDYVTWPPGQPTLTWTCFNCHKTSVLKAETQH